MNKIQEDYRVKYIRSIQNVLKINEEADGKLFSYKDRDNLNEAIGALYAQIKIDGRMSKELADELELTHLWREPEIKADEKN